MSISCSAPKASGVRSAVAVAVFLSVSSGAIAQSAKPPAGEGGGPVLRPVVVTATRTPVDIGRSLADVSVITREELEREAAPDLGTVLARLPGIEFARSGGPGTITEVFVRGANSRFTAVLIDGVPVNSQNLQGGAPWEGLPVSQVDRIEVVRGPGSAVYGSDAVAGVVQIFTRQGQKNDPRLNVSATAGSFGTTRWNVTTSGREQSIDWALAYGRDGSVGQSAIRNADNVFFNPDRDGHRNEQGSARLGWRLNADHRLDASFGRNRVRAWFDDGPDALGVSPRSTSVVRQAQAGWTARWTPELTGAYRVGEVTTTSEALGSSPYAFFTRTKALSASAQHDWQAGIHAWQALIEHRADRLNDGGTFGTSLVPEVDRRHQNALGLGYGVESGPWSFQARLREDDDSEFGRHTTGSVAGGWRFLPQWRLRASYGEGFRAPTLYERYAAFGGTADLQPETSRSSELGLNWQSGQASASLTAWRNRIGNLIDCGVTNPDPANFACTYINAGRADLQGLTLAGAVPVGDVRLSGSWDLQDPRNAETGQVLIRRARYHGKAQADWQAWGWDLKVQTQFSGGRRDLDANLADVRLGGYALWNLGATRRLNPQWQLGLRVDNVFDHRWEQSRDYRTPGAAAFVTVQYTPL